jgi:hypothetical protein
MTGTNKERIGEVLKIKSLVHWAMSSMEAIFRLCPTNQNLRFLIVTIT